MEGQRERAGRKRTFIVEEEVVSVNRYEIEATDEEDAEDRYRQEGSLIRTDIEDSSILESYPEDEEENS